MGGQGPQGPALFQKCAMVQFLKIPAPSLEQQVYFSHLLLNEITQPMTANNSIPWVLLPSEEGSHSDSGLCVSLNKSIFTLLQLAPQFFPAGSQGPHLEAGPRYFHVFQEEICPSPAPHVTWRMKNRDYRSKLIIKQMIQIQGVLIYLPSVVS